MPINIRSFQGLSRRMNISFLKLTGIILLNAIGINRLVGQVTPLDQYRWVGSNPPFTLIGSFNDAVSGPCPGNRGGTYTAAQTSDIDPDRVDFDLDSYAIGSDCSGLYSALRYQFQVTGNSVYFMLSGNLDAYIDSPTPPGVGADYYASGIVELSKLEGGPYPSNMIMVRGDTNDPQSPYQFQLSGLMTPGIWNLYCFALTRPGDLPFHYAGLSKAHAHTAGSLVFTSAPCVLPTIADQPQNVTVCGTQSTGFAVVADSDGSVSYQWQWLDSDTCGWKDVLPLAQDNKNNACNNAGGSGGTLGSFNATGIRTGSLSIEMVSPAPSATFARFRCIVHDGCGMAVTNVATLHSRGRPTADLSNDCIVDTDDYAAFASCQSGPGAAIPPGCSLADLDHDNAVTMGDFAIFQREYRAGH